MANILFRILPKKEHAMAVPAGADKKLNEKQAKRERERAEAQAAQELAQKNAKRKHAWKKQRPDFDTFRGVTTETSYCTRSKCPGVWTQQFSSVPASGRPFSGSEEPIGCFSPDK